MRFDREYYQRYYFDPRTSVTSAQEVRGRADVISSFVTYLGLPVRRILDAGCGAGLMRKHLRRRFPKAEYVGLEVSEYLCERYGWEQGSIDKYRSDTPFDIVICYDVLQYLDERAATRAIGNLTRACRGVLYFGALTRTDWLRNCDQRRTDSNVHLHTGDWYRERLRRGFQEVGVGLWLRKTVPLPLWELEAMPRSVARRKTRASKAK